MRRHFDLVVIGSGPAGEKAAAQAAYFGKTVALVERASAGGSAVADALVPSKTLREAALHISGFRSREIYGISVELDPAAKLEKLLNRAANVVTAVSQAVDENLRRHGIVVFQGQASLAPGPTVVVDSPEPVALDADVVIIASGSRPYHPPGIPFDHEHVLDSERVLKIDKLPTSMFVIGAGAVGCEYASIFAALGVQVSLVSAADRLLPFMDAELSTLLRECFEKMGIRIILNRHLERVDPTPGSLRLRLTDPKAPEMPEVTSSETVLVAGGRAPNTDGLRLEDVGIEVGGRGEVIVDEDYKTSVDRIYAVGDVIGRPALASVSMEQGRKAACRAFGFPFKQFIDAQPPSAVFSIPEIAMMGLTSEDAAARGIDYETGNGWFKNNTRALISGSTEGLVKLVFRREDRVLLGVHVLGENAAELVHQGQAVVHAGGRIDEFIDATFNVPTRSEAYKYAAYDGLQRLAQAKAQP